MAKTVTQTEAVPEQTETPTEVVATPAASFIKPKPVEQRVDTDTFQAPTPLPSDGTTPVTVENDGKQEPTLTQAQFDKILALKLGQERAKFADYNDLKAKVQTFEDSQKTEAEKTAERLATLERENQQLATQSKTSAIKAEIVAAASAIGLDGNAAYKLADVSALADDFSNVNDIVKAVADSYPGLLRQQAVRTSPVNPARSSQPVGRTDVDRAREYFGSGGSTFWGGGGVRQPEDT